MTGTGDTRGTSTVSVAMATHNGAAWVHAQLSSIELQTQPPRELVVVDDASEDETVEIVRRSIDQWSLPSSLTVHDEQRGSTATFAAAIAAAKGDIIVLSDQDDIWRRDRLERITHELDANPAAGLAFSDAVLIDGDGRRKGSELWEVAGFTQRQQRAMRRAAFGQVLSRSIVSGCTLAFRSDLRDAILPFPVHLDDPLGPMTHDRWISLVASACRPVIVIDDPLVEYRIHEQQQIGIPRLQVRQIVPSSVLRFGQLALSRETHAGRVRYYMDHLDELRSRVARLPIGGPEAVARIDAAMVHLRHRNALGAARVQRVAPVVRELARGGYHRFSLGLASAAADVLR